MRRANHPSDPNLEHLLEQNLPSLRAYVRKNLDAALASHESCADLVQSVCCEVLSAKGAYQYQGDAAFRQWLLQVALHKLMDRRRFWHARKRDAARQTDRSPSLTWSRDQLGRLAAQLGSPSGDAILHEEVARLEASLVRLSEADRDIVQRIHLRGLTHAQAAAELGCTEPQSRKRLFEALVRLSLLLRPPRSGRAS